MKIFGITIAKEIYMTIIIVLLAFIIEKTLKTIVKKTFDPDKKHKKFAIYCKLFCIIMHRNLQSKFLTRAKTQT